MCWICAIKTNKSSENAGISLCCFITPIMLRPTELHLLKVIQEGLAECPVKCRSHCSASLSTTSPTAPSWETCSRVNHVPWQYLISLLFFLNQLPYLRTASIKHKGRCFSAAHCRGNASSTLCKYTLHFSSLILMVHSSVEIFLFQRANCSLHLRGEGWKQVEKDGNFMTTVSLLWSQETYY